MPKPPLGVGRALFILLLVGCSSAERVSESKRDELRVVIIGLDGATWDLIDPLVAQGRLPHIGRLLDEGARAPTKTLLPTVSPALWTTIATGKLPEKHGITGFHYVDEASGERRPYDARHRTARTFWQIAGDHGLKSCVVYWWMTWPVEPVNGVLVSDYLFYARNAKQARQDVELDELLPYATYPASLMPMLEKKLAEARAIPAETVRIVADIPGAAMDYFLDEVDPRLGETPSRDVLTVLKNKLIESRFHLDVGLHLIDSSPFDIYVYYSKGIDATGHLFWKYHEPEHPAFAGQELNAAELELFRDVVPRFYEFEDRNVGRILERVSEDTYVLLLSDHGHHAAGHKDGPDGVFLLSGPGVRVGETVDLVGIEDLTPLILYLLGIAVGEDMDGQVPVHVFTEAHLAAHPVETIATHEGLEAAAPDALEDESWRKELESELRALGYID